MNYFEVFGLVSKAPETRALTAQELDGWYCFHKEKLVATFINNGFEDKAEADAFVLQQYQQMRQRVENGEFIGVQKEQGNLDYSIFVVMKAQISEMSVITAQNVTGDRVFTDRAKRLIDVISGLEDKKKEALLLYFNGFSYDEIACCFDEPKRTINSRFYYAKQHIKRFFPDLDLLVRNFRDPVSRDSDLYEAVMFLSEGFEPLERMLTDCPAQQDVLEVV